MKDESGQVLEARGADNLLQGRDVMSHIQKIAEEDVHSLSRLYEKNALSHSLENLVKCEKPST